MLEDLCLEAAVSGEAPGTGPAPQDMLACVDAYIKCLASHQVPRWDWPKRRLYAYIAAQEKPGLRLAQAWDAGYWRFDSDCWTPLKTFLRDLAAG